MSYLYIGVPSNFLYNQWGDHQKCEDVMKDILGYPCAFIANSLANLYDGDVYAVKFEKEEDKLIFILKNKYSLLDEKVVIKYTSKCIS